MGPAKKKTSNSIIVATIVTTGITHTEAAERFNVSTRWIRELMRRHADGGLDAVQPRSTRPHTSPTAIPAAIADRIIELRDELTAHGHDAGAATIAWRLDQEGHTSPAHSTIHRILRRARRITAQPHKRPRSSWIRFEAKLPNQRWQLDYSHWRLADRTHANILTILDDHSRYIACCTTTAVASTAAVIDCFLTAGNTHGFPQSTLSDNGSAFTARLVGGRNSFELLLDRLAIASHHGTPNHPQTQGKVERFHQTMKKALAARPAPVDRAKLDLYLAEFVAYYNHKRPHRALDRRTPASVYENTLKASSLAGSPSRHDRIRVDKVHTGKITLRYEGTLRKLYVGRRHEGVAVIALCLGPEVTVAEKDTGVILAEFHIDPTKTYQKKISGPRT